MKQNTKNYPMNPTEVKKGQSRGKVQSKEQSGRQPQHVGSGPTASRLTLQSDRRLDWICCVQDALQTERKTCKENDKKILHNSDKAECTQW